MRYRSLLVVLACSALASGCSSSTGGGGNGGSSKVTGKVTLNGNPVVDARVIFTDGAPGGMASGPTAMTDDSGQYALVGVKTGSYKVVVYKLVSKKGTPVATDENGLDLPQIEASGMGTHALPQKYARAASTTLVAEVKDGSNEVNLELKGQAGQ